MVGIVNIEICDTTLLYETENFCKKFVTQSIIALDYFSNEVGTPKCKPFIMSVPLPATHLLSMQQQSNLACGKKLLLE